MSETAAPRPTALVTGASSGFGVEFTRLFGADGWNVVMVARSGAAMEAVAQEVEERDRVALDDAEAAQGAGRAAYALVPLGPGPAAGAVVDRELLRLLLRPVGDGLVERRGTEGQLHGVVVAHGRTVAQATGGDKVGRLRLGCGFPDRATGCA